MQRNHQTARRESHEKHTIRPPRVESVAAPEASLEDLAHTFVVSPDDVPLEIEDLAPHFLFEATQSSMPSSTPDEPAPPSTRGADAALREAFFDESEQHGEQLREFERIWKHILSRELTSTEL